MKASARWLIIVAVLMSPLYASSEEYKVTCGTMLDLTAEPYEGYHFVRWADGVTDAQRTMEVTSDLFFSAIFAPDCRTYEDVPIIAITHNIFRVQTSKLAQMGYFVNPLNISWYRVVGYIDDASNLAQRDDQLIQSGAELLLPSTQDYVGAYYAEIDVASDYSGQYCGDVLRSDIIQFAAMEAVPHLMVFPNILHPNQTMTITGFPADESVMIYLYDLNGIQTELPHSATGKSFIQLTAPSTSGLYHIRVQVDKRSYPLRIFVTPW